MSRESFLKKRKHPERFANIASEGYWDLGQLVKKHGIQLTDDDCWKVQLLKIEMEYRSDGRLRVHKKGTKGNNPSPDESDSLMLAFLKLGKKSVKFHYEGGGGLGEDFWDDGD